MSNSSLDIAELAVRLRSLEETLLDPAVRRNPSAVATLLADDFQEFGSSGRIWSRAEILAHLAAEDYTSPALEHFHCALLAPTVALVTYQTVRVDPVSCEKNTVLRSSIWVFELNAWRVRFHQGTKASKD